MGTFARNLLWTGLILFGAYFGASIVWSIGKSAGLDIFMAFVSIPVCGLGLVASLLAMPLSVGTANAGRNIFISFAIAAFFASFALIALTTHVAY